MKPVLYWICAVFILQMGLCGVVKADASYVETGIPPFDMLPREGLPIGGDFQRMVLDEWGRPVVLYSGLLFAFNGDRWNCVYGKVGDAPVFGGIGKDKDGRIWASSYGDVGWLSWGAEGKLVYHPIPKSEDPRYWPSQVYPIAKGMSDGKVFFYGFLGILLVDRGEIVNVWNDMGAVYDVFEWDGRICISTLDNGVMYYNESGFWERVVGLESFSQDKTVLRAFIKNDETLLLVTLGNGLFLYDGVNVNPMPTDIDEVLMEGVLAASECSEDEMMLSVSGKGVFFLGRDGRLNFSVPSHREFELSKVLQWLPGQQGLSWGVAPEGIYLFHLPIVFTQFDENLGLRVHWPKVSRIHGKVYVVSQAKLYVGRYGSEGRLEYFDVPEFEWLDGNVSAICEAPEGMIVSTTAGVYHWSDRGGATQIEGVKNVVMLKAYADEADKILGFSPSKLILFERQDGVWLVKDELAVPFGWVNGMLQDAKGIFWLELGVGQALRVDTTTGSLNIDIITQEEGLPEGWINLFAYEGRVYMSYNGDVWYWDELGHKLVENSRRAEALFSFASGVLRPVELKDERVLLPTENGIFLLVPDGDGYRLDRDTLEHLSTSNTLVSVDGERGAWISSSRKLYFFDFSISVRKNQTPVPVVTRSYMEVSGKLVPRRNEVADSEVPVWDYSSGRLNFEVMVDDFKQRDRMLIRHKLEGLNDGWSSGSLDRTLSFTNLREGRYSLRIQAFDARGRLSESEPLEFVILAPWYRTVSAYLFYVACGLLLLWTLVWGILKNQREKSRKLENLVAERTEELHQAVKTAHAANQAKSLFLANVSHEIRTPMNAVLGMTQMLEKTPLNPFQKKYLNTIHSSGNGLLSIINDVLDLSQIESGKFILKEERVDVGHCMERLVDLLSLQAGKKGLYLAYWIHEEAWQLFEGDSQRLQQVLINLVGNAIKFTESGHIFVEVGARKLDDINMEWVFEVHDTGPGIEEKDAKQLFKPFSQLDESLTRKKGGTGLGLAICRYLVGKMGGEISVSSQLGHGSCFRFTIRGRVIEGEVDNNPCTFKSKLQGQSYHVKCQSDLEMELLERYFCLWGMHSVRDPRSADILVESLSSELVDHHQVSFQAGRLFIAHDWDALNELTESEIKRFLVSPIKHGQLIQALLTEKEIISGQSELTSEVPSAEPKLCERCPMSILVAEDNFINQEVLRAMLEDFGYEPVLVDNGEEAMEQLKQGVPDVILMDVQMPKMDGLTATQSIRKQFSSDMQPWIIAQSAGVMKQERERIEECGVNDFLAKPIMESDLKSKLERAHKKLQVHRSEESL